MCEGVVVCGEEAWLIEVQWTAFGGSGEDDGAGDVWSRVGDGRSGGQLRVGLGLDLSVLDFLGGVGCCGLVAYGESWWWLGDMPGDGGGWSEGWGGWGVCGGAWVGR